MSKSEMIWEFDPVEKAKESAELVRDVLNRKDAGEAHLALAEKIMDRVYFNYWGIPGHDRRKVIARVWDYV